MIAFVIYDINVCGGTHKQLLKLLDYTERQGQDFIVITKKLDLNKTYDGFRKYADKIKVYDYYDYPKLFRLRLIRRLLPAYNRWKLQRLIRNCDIVNIHDNLFEEIYPLLNGKKVYWQINDLHGAFGVGASAGSNINSKEAEDKRKYIIKYAQTFKAITVNVSKNAERVKRCLGRDAYVFYCGVDPVDINRDIKNTLCRFSQKKINLLSSGVFFRYRNYETQIEAVRILKDIGYDVNLHIIGDTSRDKEYATEIQNLIDTYNLHNDIIIEGQVDNSRFEYLHKNADMFLFVNIDQSWGLAVFEAMSCGLPVLVSNSVGATEILHDNVDSIFVEPQNAILIADKIVKLVSDRDYYNRVSKTASEFHKEWTWDKAYCSKMYNLMMQ